MTTPITRKKRTRRARKKNYYFTQDHEDAIIAYCATICSKERTRLYVNWIQPAFNEMVDKIVFTYKFTNLPNIDSLRDECKIWLMTILDKYDPSKGSKAFSYFSVITKNWFIHKVKRQQKRNKREVDIGNMPKNYEEEFLSTSESYVSNRLEEEFWSLFYSELKSWDSSQMKENDLKVYQAIMILFESKEDIEIFNKKAIYLYLREITGLNTKQIVNSLKKFRKKYFLLGDRPIMSKKDLDTLIEEALGNIRNDRKVAREFLNEVANQIANDPEQNKYLSPVAAKHVETLQRSNEQLVKIIALTQKGQAQSTSLSEEDKNDLFDLIQSSPTTIE